MRVADQAHSSSATHGPAVGLLSKLVIAVVALLALLLVWRPAVVHAQSGGRPDSTTAAKTQPPAPPRASESRSHVVRAGETLWGLAARYYGDGHQWQALARRNDIPISGDRPPLRVGMRLTVPASPSVKGPKAASVAALPADSTVPRIALAKAGEGTLPQPPETAKGEAKADAKAPAGALAAQTAGKGNLDAPPTRRTSARQPTKPQVEPVAAAPTATAVQDTQRADFTRQSATIMTRDGGVRIGLVDASDAGASRKSSEAFTVFHRDLPDAAEAERRTRAVLRPNTPAPRQEEFDAAPHVVSLADWEGAGRIVARVGSPATSEGVYPARAVRTDDVELKAPAGKRYAPGDRLISVTMSPWGEKGRVMVVPTGVLEVKSASADGKALAVVREQSGRIEQGQHLLVAGGTSAPRLTLEPVASPDLPTTVRWIDPAESLPTLQSFLVLGLGGAGGVKAGDEFMLYHRAAGAAEVRTALARVVRVERDHSAAVIVKQYGSEIRVGMSAKRVARVP